jgi:hypothetical protein
VGEIMNVISSKIQAEQGLDQVFFRKHINVMKKGITFFLVVIFLFVLFFISKGFLANYYTKDMLVADFKEDVSKLWETSKIIEALRLNNSDLNLNEYGTTGRILNSDEIIQNLRTELIKIADINGDKKISEEEIHSLGIMNFNEDVYSKELKNLQFNNLTVDNNLRHYVIITKGKYAGTILYNGCLYFVDSDNRMYFGLELFEEV